MVVGKQLRSRDSEKIANQYNICCSIGGDLSLNPPVHA